ncbi:MAG TPA: hypothetical protein VHA35_16115 [Dongiaceae bacterium]|jgi:hypothetical protein|nr:hypothetical protein [Dongiaceae bacterium]
MSTKARIGYALFGSLLLAACTSSGSALSQNAGSTSPTAALAAAKQAERFTAYITGYSYWDNTPVGSAQIALPVVHDAAGGQGTYADPITLAVGHSIRGGRSTPDIPAGTRFYLERLQKYAIVEDVCGDGPTPQNGPCHTGHGGYPWFDIYIGGEKLNAQTAAACARSITDLQPVVINPAPNLPVSAGAVTDSSCKTLAQSN